MPGQKYKEAHIQRVTNCKEGTHCKEPPLAIPGQRRSTMAYPMEGRSRPKAHLRIRDFGRIVRLEQVIWHKSPIENSALYFVRRHFIRRRSALRPRRWRCFVRSYSYANRGATQNYTLHHCLTHLLRHFLSYHSMHIQKKNGQKTHAL